MSHDIQPAIKCHSFVTIPAVSLSLWKEIYFYCHTQSSKNKTIIIKMLWVNINTVLDIVNIVNGLCIIIKSYRTQEIIETHGRQHHEET